MPSSVEAIVSEIVPFIYEDTRERLSLPPHTDVSRSNHCHSLTRSLHEALVSRDLEARRELHHTPDGFWHYVIAHAPRDAEPSETDIITDLNPWQFSGGKQRSGYLHTERSSVQEVLAAAEAPEWFISLRGIETIIEAHTDDLHPFRYKQTG